MRTEINRSVELVQVLLFLAERQDRTLQRVNNREYVNSITKRFAPFKAHAAVGMTRGLITDKNFIHIEPLRAILSLGSITSDIGHELHGWGAAVEKFIADTDFDGFFDGQQPYYKWITDNIDEWEIDEWLDFVEKYFRQSPDEFHLIISPIAGNYGFSLEQGGRKISYTVRFMPNYDKNGNYSFDRDFFAKGLAHEYAHCFVNPVVERNIGLLSGHGAFFGKHNNIPDFYNTDYAVINEYFVRAFQIRFMEINKNKFPRFDLRNEYSFQRERFIFIDNFISALKRFESSDAPFSEFYKDSIDGILLGI